MKYIGITIGPISDTIESAASPVALWFASSMFSDLARRLCRSVREIFTDSRICSPYYSEDIDLTDGVGKFHDRIVFSTDQYESVKLKELIAEEKRRTIEIFPSEIVDRDTVSFLEEYLQVHFAVLEESQVKGNILLEISPYLDALELVKTFPADDSKDPLKKLMRGEENRRNQYVRESRLFRQINKQKNQFIDPETQNIRSILSLGTRTDAKSSRYFAVVQADGDNMSTFLEKIRPDQIGEFSGCCFEYAQEASRRIGAFGGMTVYAGGDDLLFLAPLEEAGKTVFDLCQELNRLFQSRLRERESFRTLESIPTVSFGISIQYEKFPLYEALKNARRLLFDVVKGDDNTKNSMAVELLKHSGQRTVVRVSNRHADVLAQILQAGCGVQEKEGDERTINSLLYTLRNFRPLLEVMDAAAVREEMDYERYHGAFCNLFDNSSQKSAQEYVDKMCRIYYESFVKQAETTFADFISMLQLRKFLLEKGEN